MSGEIPSTEERQTTNKTGWDCSAGGAEVRRPMGVTKAAIHHRKELAGAVSWRSTEKRV